MRPYLTSIVLGLVLASASTARAQSPAPTPTDRTKASVFSADDLAAALVLSGYTWDWIGSAWTYSLGAVFALIGLLVLIGGWREPSAGERV